uniref:Carbonic anhydrase n=1 Tax=Anas platyrhynchos platyrhynchos TaxID=8840 RepID=A0A493T6C6_ANAPP
MTVFSLLVVAAWIRILCLQRSSKVKILESLRLEKTSKVIRSNHPPTTTITHDAMSVNFTFLSQAVDNKEACSHLPIVFGEYIQWIVCLESQVCYHLCSFPVLIGGPLPRGHEFELHDVRFHWGRENQRGSEHTVNFKAFPMELHLMHWNSTLYSSIDEAVGKKHGIAIIALFVQIGKEHVGLKAVTEILQDIQYKGKSKTIPCFNPNSLLPDPLLRDYWVYEGSLTIPPCSEGVTWILFRYPLTVSQVQIEEFRRLRTHVKGAELLEGCDGILGDNFRPTQPLSDRVIRAAFQ